MSIMACLVKSVSNLFCNTYMTSFLRPLKSREILASFFVFTFHLPYGGGHKTSSKSGCQAIISSITCGLKVYIILSATNKK